MPISKYRVNEVTPAELNTLFASIDQRFSKLEQGPNQPLSDIDMSGKSLGKSTVTPAIYKIRNMAPGVDEHDAVTLGQLTKALQSVKGYYDSGGTSRILYIRPTPPARAKTAFGAALSGGITGGSGGGGGSSSGVIQAAGNITITGTTATSAAIAVPSSLGTAYYVSITASAYTGTPNAGAFTVINMTKSSGSFTFTLLDVPGGTNSITFDYIVAPAVTG